jgi:hypothetical protein
MLIIPDETSVACQLHIIRAFEGTEALSWVAAIALHVSYI